MKRSTFLLSITIIMLLVSCLISSPARAAATIVVRARGTTGSEQIRLSVGIFSVQVWTLTTSMADYTATTSLTGDCKVNYINDVNNDTAVQIDYITVDGDTRQAEAQAINTGCSSSYSEWLYCNGYINFSCVNCNNVSLSPTSLSLAADANSTGSFDVNSNTNWTVSSNQTWLTDSPTSGLNIGTVTVTAQENASTSPRTATVTVSGTNAASKTVTVTQAPILSVWPRWLLVAAEANSACIFNISSIKSWTVSSDQTWLTVSPASGSNNGTVTATAQQNTDPSTRTATVTVSVAGASQTVMVIQRCAGGACDVLPMPPYSNLTNNSKLPDPFTSLNGYRITTKSEWTSRRAEIAALAQKFEFGYKQDTPYSATTGSMSGNSLTVTVTDNGHTISFPCSISYPTTGTPPYPALIACGIISLDTTAIRNLGVAIITFPSDTIAQENGGTSRGIGLFYDMYGSSHSSGALMAFAWGMDRLIDAIEKTADCNIDPTRLGVTGCSRWGKGALACGAFDERLILTIPQESGSGGAASWRVSDWQMAQGTNVQTLGEITGENVWFRDDFNQFNSSAIKLPFDHHTIEGLCAPRALLVIENSSQIWNGDVSTWTTGKVAHKIWEALKIPDMMGYSSVGNHNHCAFPVSQQPEVTAYIQKFLVGGGTADTNVMKIDGGEIYNEPLWVDWTVPNLQLLGDFDNSGKVDFIDFAILANAWMSNPAQANWDARCDIAKPPDNVIDILDLEILAQNWLKVDGL